MENLREEVSAQQENINFILAQIGAIGEFLQDKYPGFEEYFNRRTTDIKRILNNAASPGSNNSNLEGGKKKTTRKKTTKKKTTKKTTKK